MAVSNEKITPLWCLRRNGTTQLTRADVQADADPAPLRVADRSAISGL
jgi:hypothetical protein